MTIPHRSKAGGNRTIIYVDGFNLYYGALRKTPYRWLDLNILCKFLLPGNEIREIKYFTALVSGRPNDPGQPVRQQAYLRALQSLPNVSVYLGHFLTHKVWMPRADAPYRNVRVIKTEEKGSDVNLAAELLHDAHRNRFDVAAVVSNDSDLLAPIRIVKNELNKHIGVLNPHKRPSQVLHQCVDFIKPIRSGVLSAAQFPDELTDQTGTFFKPKSW
ncbi:MAG: NYN domain-containing protein [Gammaproteobacteria bacterium]|nr:NYN domain-containing protein [Gammaproteobacteria bacterium]